MGVFRDSQLLPEDQVELWLGGSFFCNFVLYSSCTHSCIKGPYNVLYRGWNFSCIWKMKWYKLLCVSGRGHVTLYELHCYQFCFQVQFKVLVFTFKVLNSFGSGYLRDHSSQFHLLIPPDLVELACYVSFYLGCHRQWSFSAVLPILWNPFPSPWNEISLITPELLKVFKI